ncbi:aminotransferase class I/II-fold pyridoxal phosphate-dependent enzyme [Streptomyces broussonetiae]|uniref:aminotransferase class I/II-fold pyridoxal phosphate-dependent enzyme n=1 Tax=Streptomyces broussonetiae TaxID=2686304 RepID=UPI0022793E2C|nr:aminotransferase class I/II-fold pyridoxal phosphate-dependent enzyme [Streptomyces broussonetiae]
MATAKQYLTYATGTPFQAAVAAMLASKTAWVAGLRDDLQTNRDLLREGLCRAGLTAFPGEGGYFVQADVRAWGHPDGERFCRELPLRAGVVAVPTSAFYQGDEVPGRLVRFSFCKDRQVVKEAVRRLVAAR